MGWTREEHDRSPGCLVLLAGATGVGNAGREGVTGHGVQQEGWGTLTENSSQGVWCAVPCCAKRTWGHPWGHPVCASRTGRVPQSWVGVQAAPTAGHSPAQPQGTLSDLGTAAAAVSPLPCPLWGAWRGEQGHPQPQGSSCRDTSSPRGVGRAAFPSQPRVSKGGKSRGVEAHLYASEQEGTPRAPAGFGRLRQPRGAPGTGEDGDVATERWLRWAGGDAGRAAPPCSPI